MKASFFSLAISLFALGVVSNAEAEQVVWSTVGSACIVDSPFASKINTGNLDGSVRFASGQTDHIQMTCPVHQDLTDCPLNNLQVTAIDPDGANRDSYVSVWFNANPASGGNGVSNLASVYSESGNGTKSTTRSKNRFGALDFDKNYYWVSVEMYRAHTGLNPVFFGAQVFCTRITL